jgi:hypothetical protein
MLNELADQLLHQNLAKQDFASIQHRNAWNRAVAALYRPFFGVLRHAKITLKTDSFELDLNGQTTAP